ncbi:MAG: acyl-CoA dehydrogenase family protein [Ginsengibacter sp.]
MNTRIVPHPSFFIDEHIIDTLRKYAGEAERAGSLNPQQLSIIYKEHWFNLFVPKEYGGLELSLPEALSIEEALAWADGSTGWTVTLCSGANWFIGFLNPETAEMIFDSKKVCLAGSGRANGIARLKGDEYEITGKWPYATGAGHATAFTANCLLEKDGKIMKNEDGTDAVASFIFLKEEVSVYEDWKEMGMKATSSNSFEVKKLKVDKKRLFIIDETKTVLPGKIYQYPFLQFAEATLAVNVSGMAIHYLDLFEGIMKEKNADSHYTNDQLLALSLRHDTAKTQLNEARQLFHKTIQRSWNEGKGSKDFTAETLKDVSLVSRELADTARRMVDEMYPYCGMFAANPSTEINRVWRNLHTACLHPLLLK